VKVNAGSVSWWEYSFPQGADVRYESYSVGERPYDIGVIKETDLNRYRSGESVPVWVYEDYVTQASEEGNVYDGEIAFVISCQSQQPCDVYVRAVWTYPAG